MCPFNMTVCALLIYSLIDVRKCWKLYISMGICTYDYNHIKSGENFGLQVPEASLWAPWWGCCRCYQGCRSIKRWMGPAKSIDCQNRWRFVSDFTQVWRRRPFCDSPAVWKLPQQTAVHFLQINLLCPTLLSKNRQFPCAEGAWPFQPLCYSKGCEKPTGSNIVPADPCNQRVGPLVLSSDSLASSLGAAAVERRCKV